MSFSGRRVESGKEDDRRTHRAPLASTKRIRKRLEIVLPIGKGSICESTFKSGWPSLYTLIEAPVNGAVQASSQSSKLTTRLRPVVGES